MATSGAEVPHPLEFVNCQLCDTKELKGSEGLALHFTSKHSEFLTDDDPPQTSKDTIRKKNFVFCPVCHLECSGQRGLNRHFNAAHVDQDTQESKQPSGKEICKSRSSSATSSTKGESVLVDCPLDSCDTKKLKGSRGLAVHFRSKHNEFLIVTDDLSQTLKDTRRKENGVRCPVCRVEFVGQHEINEHFKTEHPRPMQTIQNYSSYQRNVESSSDDDSSPTSSGREQKERQSCKGQRRKRSPENSASRPSVKVTGEGSCSQKLTNPLINCPVTGCGGTQFKGLRGLGCHFRKKHAEYKIEARFSGSEETAEIGVMCPVCHIDCTGQQDLDDHFTGALRKDNGIRCPVCYFDCVGQRGLDKHFVSAHPPSYSTLFECDDTKTTPDTEIYEEMNEMLLQLAREVRPNRKDSREQSKRINVVRATIMDELVTKTDTSHIRWLKPEGAGSSYEKLKIGEPDEYDTVFMCKINCCCEYGNDYGKSNYCHVKVLDSNFPEELCTEDGYICPKAFMDSFKKAVEDAKTSISHIYKERRYGLRKLSVTGSCMVPAVTLQLDDCSIDLVPAICIPGWPESCSE